VDGAGRGRMLGMMNGKVSISAFAKTDSQVLAQLWFQSHRR
jgi:hypothetical protein